MANSTVLKSLKNESLKVYTGMIMEFPWYKIEIPMRVIISDSLNYRYSVKNEVIAFVLEGEKYVAPYSRNIMEKLIELDFKETVFYVPFSHGDCPKNEEEKEKWENLKKMANEEKG